MPTALIVEDEPEANRLLSLLVQLRGYQTESALTGGQALACLSNQRPDIIFLDLMLPDTDGFELCRTITTQPETSLIPVVIVTARLVEESRQRSFELGAHAFIPKPYTPEQVFSALTSADAWNRELARRSNSGEIRLDAGLEDFARGLSRLRGLLLARTPLGNQAVSQIVATLRAIRADARAWAQRRQVDRVATAAYHLQDDRFTLSIRDEAGWFAGGELPDPAGRAGAFDETTPGPSQSEAILTKHYSTPDLEREPD